MTRAPHRLRRTRAAATLALVFGVGLAVPARAALTQAELSAVVAEPSQGARLPVDRPFVDTHGANLTLRQRLGGRPTVLMLADTRCTQLCGPILSIVGRALAGSGLTAGRDYGLVVVSFNPAATLDDGLAMRDAQFGATPAIAAAAQIVRGTPDATAAIETALGYTAVYDADAKRFAHPTDVFVVTPDGRLSRELGGLSLDPDTVRLALVEAGQGSIGTVADRLHLLCYGLDPVTGRYTGFAITALRLGAGLTLAGLAGTVLLLLRRRGPTSGRA